MYNEWTPAYEDKLFATGLGNVSGWSYYTSVLPLTSWTSVAIDKWHDIAYVYDGSQQRVYLDGKILVSSAAGGNVGNGDGQGFIGAIYRDGGIHPGIVGYLANLRISDTCRYYGNSYMPPIGDLTSDASTQLLYNFNEPAGSTTVYDESPLGRTGSLGVGFAGATSPVFVPDPIAVPEPSTFALLGTATLGLLGFLWRRRKPA